MKFNTLTITAVMLSNILLGQNDLGYQTPPEPLNSLVDIMPAPLVSIAPNNDYLLLVNRNFYKTIEEVSQEEYRLAGSRINPANFTQSRQSFYTSFSIYNIETEENISPKNLPKNSKFYGLSYSPKGDMAAVLEAKQNEVKLWVLNIKSGELTQINSPAINDVISGMPYSWLPDGSGFLIKTKSSIHTGEPKKPTEPAGPVIQEADGKKSTVRTYQDLLKNPYQEQLFEYFISADLHEVKLNGSTKKLLENQLIRSFSISPDGNYLMYEIIEKPFSYLVPWSAFPSKTFVLNLNKPSELVLINEKPLTINLPQGFDATMQGKRGVNWRSDLDATLYWVEALDGGDPSKEVDFRDQLYLLEKPFTGKAKPIAATKLRYAGVQWGNNNTAILYDR